jgi:hypothetical protein
MLLAAVDVVNAITPAHLWSKSFGSTNNDTPYAVAVDADGSIILVGAFQGSVDFGGGVLASAGGDDIFIAKYDAGGAHLWSQRFGSTQDDQARGVTTDAAGNVYVTGKFRVTVSFGGGNHTSAGQDDIFLARYNADGYFLWSQSYGSTSTDIGGSVAVDGSGNVLLTGVFSGSVSFGGGSLISAGLYDGVLAKYDAGGAHQWSQRVGGNNWDVPAVVLADASGNAFLAGYFAGTANYGGGSLVSAGGYDIVLAKYNSNGVHQWSQRFGGTGDDAAASAALDGSGDLLVTGYFNGAVSVGGAVLANAGFADVFVAKYSSGGVHQWSQSFGGTDYDAGAGVAADAEGNTTVTGYFVGTVSVGGPPLVSAGFADPFVARYNASGVHLWSRRCGGTDGDYPAAIAQDPAGGVVFTSTFIGTADFGGSLTSAGAYDIALAKFANLTLEPVIESITDIANDQGRKVKIRFDGSGADNAYAPNPVTRYLAYRRNDPPPASAMPGGRALLDEGWTEVGWVNAFGKDSYGIDVPTIGDSTEALGQYYSVFFIRAAGYGPSVFHDSAPDSGWSVDNLAPGVPGGLLYSSGQLSWNESTAGDFDYFTVYGANTDDFGAAVVVDYTVPPAMDVTSAGYVFYFVTATDLSGNEGQPAKIHTLSGTGGTPQSYVLSVSNHPNPFNPRTTVSYTVPSRGTVTVAIYDVRGARVATLVGNEVRNAGAYRVDWNGRADGGALVPSGVYFARIEQGGKMRIKKMVLLK